MISLEEYHFLVGVTDLCDYFKNYIGHIGAILMCVLHDLILNLCQMLVGF
jgi:hypothetical protein